jgi:hypothetical protein
MPSGAVSQLPEAHPRSRAREQPSPLLRLRVRLQASKLDRALAGGADPRESPELELRASQLVDPDERERIATSIDQLLHLAGQDRRRFLGWSRMPFDRLGVRASWGSLRKLAELLRGPRTPSPRGVAMARLLIGDFRGPIYTTGRANRLPEALAATISALER